MEKTTKMINDEVETTAHHFAVEHKLKILGSNATRGMLYPSDYDFESKLSGRADAIYQEFRKVFKNKKFMNSIYLCDFKCGVDERFVPFNINNPLIPKQMRQKIKKATGEEKEDLERELYILRWSQQDIINGYIILVDGTKKSFVDCLDDNTTIKVDWAVPVGNTFAECSINYYYKQEPQSKEQTIQELKEDVDYYKHNNTMKSMKRFYSLLTTINEDKKKQKELVKYFNSPIGYINKIKNDLEFLLELTLKHNIEWDKIKSNLQMLKNNLSNSALPSTGLILEFNHLSQSNYKNKIKKIINKLQTIINEVSKNYLRQIE
mgnify:FL=1